MVKLKGSGPVVIVDDDPGSLRIAQLVFEDSNVPNEVLLFQSGRELLVYLEGVKQGRARMPAIVLMDINMPGANGHEIVRAMRSMNDFSEEPRVVMLTSSNDPDDVTKAFRAGADAYQVKPFGIDEFLAFTDSLLPADAH